ncbi:hypothetical protein COY23_02250 [bacterium (Candidatus Torokbacteria) CG_4_10_14_0_2_um_filter_35_8]|nr:MAG: hypothetical protein COY23_02250 [bacterium (Candidatus Torokbacteria) CG_4_10_14_0_2_um_filter_35_8]
MPTKQMKDIKPGDTVWVVGKWRKVEKSNPFKDDGWKLNLKGRIESGQPATIVGDQSDYLIVQ